MMIYILDEIQDNGTGIDDDIFPRLLEKFALKSFQFHGQLQHILHWRKLRRIKVLAPVTKWDYVFIRRGVPL